MTKTPFEGILLLLAESVSQITAAMRIMKRIAKSTLYLFRMISMVYTPIYPILILLLEHWRKVCAEILRRLQNVPASRAFIFDMAASPDAYAVSDVFQYLFFDP